MRDTCQFRPVLSLLTLEALILNVCNFLPTWIFLKVFLQQNINISQWSCKPESPVIILPSAQINYMLKSSVWLHAVNTLYRIPQRTSPSLGTLYVIVNPTSCDCKPHKIMPRTDHVVTSTWDKKSVPASYTKDTVDHVVMAGLNYRDLQQCCMTHPLLNNAKNTIHLV